MTARTGMAYIITELRGMTNAGTADYTIAGSAYWTDDQLQAVLDDHRTEVTDEVMFFAEDNTGGTITTTRYYSSYGWFEQTTGGSLIFTIKDGTHALVGTASWSSVDYRTGRVVFTADTNEATRYLSGRSYDVYAAAADVWRRKASQVTSASYSWSTDNMSVNKGQMRAEYLKMADYYSTQGGVTSVQIRRSDTDAE